jgi:hypothetical protein
MALLAFAHAAEAHEATPPFPPPRPDRPASQPPEAPEATKPDAAVSEKKASESDPEDAACLERITRLGLRFEIRPAVQEGACSVKNPVLVSALPNGIEVSPASLMACSFAEGLVRWTNDVVRAEAERHFQSEPTKLLIGTSYQCRDQRSGAKLSEHAFGNGVDVMGFAFAKRDPLTIGKPAEGTPEAAFQAAVRTGACPIFSTVLGPGSDADHGDHLHLDMRARKGDYRICQ